MLYSVHSSSVSLPAPSFHSCFFYFVLLYSACLVHISVHFLCFCSFLLNLLPLLLEHLRDIDACRDALPVCAASALTSPVPHCAPAGLCLPLPPYCAVLPPQQRSRTAFASTCAPYRSCVHSASPFSACLRSLPHLRLHRAILPLHVLPRSLPINCCLRLAAAAPPYSTLCNIPACSYQIAHFCRRIFDAAVPAIATVPAGEAAVLGACETTRGCVRASIMLAQHIAVFVAGFARFARTLRCAFRRKHPVNARRVLCAFSCLPRLLRLRFVSLPAHATTVPAVLRRLRRTVFISVCRSLALNACLLPLSAASLSTFCRRARIRIAVLGLVLPCTRRRPPHSSPSFCHCSPHLCSTTACSFWRMPSCILFYHFIYHFLLFSCLCLGHFSPSLHLRHFIVCTSCCLMCIPLHIPVAACYTSPSAVLHRAPGRPAWAA